MYKTDDILTEIRKQTDEVILFTSITGKDSILLTHLCSQKFNKVYCVFMYIVDKLEHIARYQRFFENNYSNLKYYHIPHFTLSWYIKSGYLGIQQDKSQKKYQLGELDKMMKEKIGCSWSVYGMKRSDGLNRNLQLSNYPMHGICRASKKAYPLADYNNHQVEQLISHYNLPAAIKYNNDRSQSVELSDPGFLNFLYEKYPSDLEKIFIQFPGVKHKFYQINEKN